MTITSVGFVPCAPLLVPVVAGGSADVDESLRSSALDVVRGLFDANPGEIVIVAPTAVTGNWAPPASWDFAGFGVARDLAPDASRLPWQLGIGAWLLDECGWNGRRNYVGIGPASSMMSIIDDGEAILVLGDGSGCRTEKAPGHLDPRAEAYDAVIANALAAGDLGALAGLDPELSRELLCAGAPVWRWLATAIGTADVASATLEVAEAPYGVAYFVASWTMA